MRLLLKRSTEVRRGDELAKIGITLLVLGEEREPVDARFAADLRWPRNRQERPDDRLHTSGETGVAERHRPVKPVTIAQRRGREAKPGNPFGDGLWLHRAFEHGEGRKDTKRDVRR